MENLPNTQTEPLPESKIDATRRLQREGRWEEASAFRRQLRSELRSLGTPKAEANEEAWAAMIEKFPPLPSTEAAPNAAEEELQGLLGGEEVDLVADTFWVYQHLADKTVKPEDAPGPGAWALLEWSRQYRNKFFESLLPKALAMKEKRGPDGEGEAARRERRSLEELAGELKDFWDVSKHTSLNEFGLED